MSTTITTAQMVTLCRTRIGEDSTTATQVSDSQIVDLLNERLTELCADSNVLVSGWTTSTIAGQQQYSVPSEYTSVEAVRIFRTNLDNARWWLAKVPIIDTNPDTASTTQSTPNRFSIWGLNVSGNNNPAIWLDPIPKDSGTNDLICYGRQRAKVLVSGGQGPEVPDRWCYAVVNGAIALIYLRFAEGSADCLALADRYEKLWQSDKGLAQEYISLDVYSPGYARDTMGYMRR